MAVGSIVVNVTTSNQLVPIPGASVSVELENGEGKILAGFRTSNRNGVTTPIIIETPEASFSQEPGTSAPFAVCNIIISHPAYEQAIIYNAQVFAGIESVQNTALIPLPENAGREEATANYYVTSQNL